MYLSLEIKDFDQLNIDVAQFKKDRFKKNNKALLNGLHEYILNKDNILSATKIQEHLFPEIEADIFLSHAHTDEDQVISLAVYLEDMGFKVFVDSCVWGNAFELLKEIDEKHCKFEGGNTYNYQKRNFSTATVYMILNAALHRMIENSELFIFLGTENSLTIEDSIENQYYLRSPWIFSELTFVNQVVRFDKRFNLRSRSITSSIAIEDSKKLALDESLQMRFNKPKLDFSLSNDDFLGWLNSETNQFTKEYTIVGKEFEKCEDHIKSLEKLYDLMRKNSERNEYTVYQQYIKI